MSLNSFFLIEKNIKVFMYKCLDTILLLDNIMC